MKTIAFGVSFFALALLVTATASASDYKLTEVQLDRVTASGGQITSIGPAKAKASTSVRAHGKRRSAGRGFF